MALSRQAQAPGRADLRLLAAAVDMPPLKSVCLLGQLRQRIQLRHPAEMVLVRYWVAAVLVDLQGVHRVLARLLHSAGMGHHRRPETSGARASIFRTVRSWCARVRAADVATGRAGAAMP